MSGVQTEHVFEGSREKVFKAITSYRDYPGNVPFVQKITVLPPAAAGSAALVRYDLNLIKQFFYSLNMYHDEPGSIRWDLHESDILKVSQGSWQLSPVGKSKTKATYTVEVAARVLVPKLIVNQLTKTALPATLEGFQKLIDAQK